MLILIDLNKIICFSLQSMAKSAEDSKILPEVFKLGYSNTIYNQMDRFQRYVVIFNNKLHHIGNMGHQFFSSLI